MGVCFSDEAHPFRFRYEQCFCPITSLHPPTAFLIVFRILMPSLAYCLRIIWITFSAEIPYPYAR